MLCYRLYLPCLLSVLLLTACQTTPSETVTVELPTPTVTPPPLFTSTPTPSPTSPSTSTVTPTPTPIPTSTPTATPIPSDRLGAAQRAYINGDHETARQTFDALLSDPGADPNEKRLALHWRGRSELHLGDTAAAIATLKLFVTQYPSDELTRTAQFNLGQAYQQAGQPREAVVAYLGSIIPDDPANVYIYERIGDVALEAEDYQSAINAYQSGINATDDTKFHVHLREGIAQASLLQDDPGTALAQYNSILDVAKIDTYRAKILRLAGDTYLAANNPDAAYQQYQQAVDNYPAAYDSYLALVELVNANIAVDEYQRGLIDYHAGSYDAAIAAFERYLAGPPPVPETPGQAITQTAQLTATVPITESVPPPHVADAVWFTAQAWKSLGGYTNALTTLQEFINTYPDHEHWGQAHLDTAEIQVDLDSITPAKNSYRNFADQNPTNPLAAEALWRAARLDLDGDLLAEARNHLIHLADTQPNSDYADDALYWAGRASFLQEDYPTAVADWQKQINAYPTGDLSSFGHYWQAKTLMMLGEDEQAREILTPLSYRPLDYYGLRARDLLNGTAMPTAATSLALPTAEETTAEKIAAEAWLAEWLQLPNAENLSTPGVQLQNDSAFQRGQALLSLGLQEEALAEFETARETWADNGLVLYQLSDYFHQHHMGRLGILSAGRLISLSPAGSPEQTPLYIQRLFYPVYFADLVLAQAETHEIDPTLILALTRQESLFEASAHSHAGARGLMQIMPATGEYITQRSGMLDNYSPDDLWRPYLNIQFGAWYINQQLGIFNGNAFAALAAYNAGPGNVLEWVRTSDDLDIFVEAIPFWESRLYVRKVYVNLSAYRNLYGTIEQSD